MVLGHHNTVPYPARPSSAPTKRTMKAQEQAAARADGETLPIGAVISFTDKSPRAASGQRQDIGGSSSQAISSSATVSANSPVYKPALNMQGTYALQPATQSFGSLTARGNTRRPYSATFRSDSRYVHPVVLESELYDCAFDPKAGRPVGSHVAADGRLWPTAMGKVTSAGASQNYDTVKRSFAATSRKLPAAESYYFTNKRGVSLEPPITEWEVRALYKSQVLATQQQQQQATETASTGSLKGPQKTVHYVDANTLQRTMQASGQLSSTYGGTSPVTAHDLTRTQPWTSPALGRHAVPGANSTKHVAGQWRYVPVSGQLRDGHAIMTASYV